AVTLRIFILLLMPRPPSSTLFPYTTLFRSWRRSRPWPLPQKLLLWGQLRLRSRRPPSLIALLRFRRLQERRAFLQAGDHGFDLRSEEHTSELQSRENLVCRLLLEKKKKEEI